MKILCILTGLAIDDKKWDDPLFSKDQALENVKKGKIHLNHVLSNNDVDYYCHVWGNRSCEFIVENYNPKVLICEDQISFQTSCYSQYFDSFCSMPPIRSPSVPKNLPFKINDSWEYFSRIYSQLHSRSYISKYLLDLNNSSRICLSDYDLIILTRYDISSRGGFNISNIPNVNLISNLNELQESEFLIFPTFNQLNDGYPDMWYLSNSHYFLNNISKQSSLWVKSILTDSEYFFLRENGWPLSEIFDINNPNDQRQFSNKQINKNISSSKTMKYPRYHNLNVHAFIKYSFWIDPRLFRQTKFIDTQSIQNI